MLRSNRAQAYEDILSLTHINSMFLVWSGSTVAIGHELLRILLVQACGYSGVNTILDTMP